MRLFTGPLILGGLSALLLLAFPSGTARAARSYDNCTGYIDALPATISTQGTWCLRKDVSTGIASGAAITVATNNVAIDCNDFKIGGLAAGAGTMTDGIHATDRSNITVRNCNIRGFRRGVALLSYDPVLPRSSGHLVEGNRFNGNTFIGVILDSDASAVRDNMVFDTGGSPSAPSSIGIVASGSIDITDNTVSGVSGVGSQNANVSVYGISSGLNPGTIRGNRVRGLVRKGNGDIVGIMAGTIDMFYDRVLSTTLRENDVILDTPTEGSYGLHCGVTVETPNGPLAPGGRARDNTAQGFANGLGSCGDAGGNDVSSH